MILIAHRGNVNGPNPERENTISYLQEALDAGYSIEVDVWTVNASYKLIGIDGTTSSGVLWSNKLWLGHDKPLEEVPLSFLRDSRVWVHCKDVDTYTYLSKFPDVNCFEQEDQSLSVTSRGYHWAGSSNQDQEFPMIRFWDGSSVIPSRTTGIYSDFAGRISGSKNPELPFDLLVIDIDGVMTSGKMYGLDGKVIGKSFYDLDFTAIKRFKSAGVKVCFLSGDKTVNEAMAATRKVDFHSNVLGVDKVEMIAMLEDRYMIPRNRMAYVGDDYYDIGIMSQVGSSFCPASSPAIVKRAATIVLQVEAGKGVIASLYDAVEDRLPSVYPVDSPGVNP